MNLSNSLVSQFVKVVNDTGKTPTNTDVNGTVVGHDGTFRVRLDGSDILTPVNSTAEIQDGDRVLVKVIDHRATVIGNATAPSASLNTVNKKYGEFDIIKADYGEFKTLVTEDFTATNAKIENLTVDYGEFKTLVVDDLEATNAVIQNLDAKQANIETLIFGSATGESISTTFANSVISQVGTAQIKSAQIDFISADKITSGKVKTNLVDISSENGNMLISGETIQIKDSNRVRVQIGKDASNDYSINVWDASGNLMFSEGGITDKAIKTGIIRNDMVSDTANISAGKLDIDSLFTEINGSDKTIISSKIYFDDKDQTLDVLFETMSDNVSTYGTEISAIQGQISSKIWQTDINSVADTITQQYTSLEQNLNSFKTTVSSTYATSTSLTQTATDLTAKITAAGKTASNYLKFDGSGLTVGDMTGSTLGNNVLIDSDSVDIRSGSTVSASFSEDIIELGKNSTTARISLLNNTAEMYVDKNTFVLQSGKYILIDSDDTLQLSNNLHSLTLNSTAIDFCSGNRGSYPSVRFLPEKCEFNIPLYAVGASIFDGEVKYYNTDYDLVPNDTAPGVGCTFKSSRGLFNELLLDKLILTGTADVRLPIYKYTGTSGGQMTGLTEIASISKSGTFSGSGVSVTGTISANNAAIDSSLDVKGAILARGGLELYHATTPYFDFHYGNSSGDYTSRIIETASGTIAVNGVQCKSGGYLTAPGASSFGSTLSIGGITTISKRIQPAADGSTANYVQLGAESARFKYVYCMQSAMSTSDLNAKRDLTFIDDRYIRLFDLIEPYAYYFKSGDRVHTGFIAQYVEAAMEEVGLTAVELAFFCKNVKIEYEYDENGNYVSEHKVYDENGDPVYEYSLRYEEYIAIMVAKLKHMERKFEKRLKALEEKEKQNG